jgi:glycosyltransferase involved in cell wall biosynthesis
VSVAVLYLSYLGDFGGGESSLLTTLCALDRTRFAPRVVCGTGGAFVEELRSHSIPADVIPFTLPYFKHGWLPTASLDFFPRLAAYLRAQGVALIHCNTPEAAYYAAPLAKFARIPIVWTCHAWWQAERGWKSRFYENMLAHIITPTRYIQNCLVEMSPRLRERISVIPFGVDTRVFAPGTHEDSLPAEWNLAPDAPIVTLLARFQSVKGHEILLDAVPHILDAFPAARFLFVGDSAFDTTDANETRARIHARVAGDERLRAAVVFCGFRRDIPRLLRASDLVVCPSWFETFGVANVEAMSCGIPVVSTNVGGPAEKIVDGETGFLVPPRDPNALAARVVQLLADPVLRHSMGVNARRRVERLYDVTDTVMQLERVYEMIL